MATIMKRNGKHVVIYDYYDADGKRKQKWESFTGALGMIRNHIVPLVGSIKLQDIMPRDIDLMFNKLRDKKVFTHNADQKKGEDIPCLSSTTLRHIWMSVKKAFDKAVDWKLIQRNPVVCDAPQKNKASKAIWDSNTLRLALESMRGQPLLHLAVHLAFICSMRIGEIMGLTLPQIEFILIRRFNGCPRKLWPCCPKIT